MAKENFFNPETKDQLEIVTPVKQEYKLIESIKNIHNLPLWSWNSETGEIKKVKMVKQMTVDTNGNPDTRSRVNYDPKLYYCIAINIKNARKKFTNFITRES